MLMPEKDNKTFEVDQELSCSRHGMTDHRVLCVLTKAGHEERVFASCYKCREEGVEREKHLLASEKAQKVREEAMRAKQREDERRTRLANANIPPRFATATLDNYIVECEGQRKAVEACRWFLSQFPAVASRTASPTMSASSGMAFLGKNGTGKNHLAVAIVAELVARGYTSMFDEFSKIDRAIKETWAKSDGLKESEVLAKLAAPDVLVIDEIGVQRGTPTEVKHMTELINDRYNWLRPTILCGNVTLSELKVLIGDRAYDRLRDGGRVVVFDWDSERGRTR